MDGLRLWDLYAAAALAGLAATPQPVKGRISDCAAAWADRMMDNRAERAMRDDALGPPIARRDDRGLPRCGSALGVRACWLAAGHDGEHTDGFVPWRSADSFAVGGRSQ